MTNIIKIKRSGVAGTATPTVLAEGELAYSENSKNLFIGTNGGVDIQIVGGKTAIDKLATVETSADVTDSTNVDAAGAVMNSDTTTIGMSFVIDEDDMSSNLDTKVPTQQSVRQYVNDTVSSGVTYKGGYDAALNVPDLDVAPSGIVVGDMYTVTAAGVFFSTPVEVGDVLISEIINPTTVDHWTIVNKNLDAASIKVAYESNADTNAYTDADETTVGHISVTQAVDLDTMESDIATNNGKVTNATHSGDVAGSTVLTIGNDKVDEEHVNWGTGASQVSAVDMPIADAGSIILGVNVETALQENRVAINVNSGKTSNISTSLSVGTNNTTTLGITSDGGADDVLLPAATGSLTGVVTAVAQTFGGTKSFEDISGTDVGSTLDSFVIDGGAF
jgi:hypothetical protein